MYLPNTNIEIADQIGIISSTSMTTKELNCLDLNGELILDLREWSLDHTKASAGVLLTFNEAQELVDLLYDLGIFPSQEEELLEELSNNEDDLK